MALRRRPTSFFYSTDGDSRAFRETACRRQSEGWREDASKAPSLPLKSGIFNRHRFASLCAAGSEIQNMDGSA